MKARPWLGSYLTVIYVVAVVTATGVVNIGRGNNISRPGGPGFTSRHQKLKMLARRKQSNGFDDDSINGRCRCYCSGMVDLLTFYLSLTPFTAIVPTWPVRRTGSPLQLNILNICSEFHFNFIFNYLCIALFSMYTYLSK